MAFNPRNAVKKERKFDGKIYKFYDRSPEKMSNDYKIERLHLMGYSVRQHHTKDEWGYKIVDIYIRRK